MRLLDGAKIAYEVTTYEVSDGKIDGEAVASKIGKSVEQVFKTLVAIGKSKVHYVFVIPVSCELDLKKASIAVGEKSIEMLPVKDLQKVTGYIRGGCSPIGMKKTLKTCIDERAKSQAQITVSGGKIGVQITLQPQDLANYIGASFIQLSK